MTTILGRPPGVVKQTIAVRLPVGLIARLKRRAAREGVPISLIVERALKK